MDGEEKSCCSVDCADWIEQYGASLRASNFCCMYKNIEVDTPINNANIVTLLGVRFNFKRNLAPNSIIGFTYFLACVSNILPPRFYLLFSKFFVINIFFNIIDTTKSNIKPIIDK